MKKTLFTLIVGCVLAACGSPQRQSQKDADARTVKSETSESSSQKALTAAGARDVGLPDFDTAVYCQRIGTDAGGSAQIEETCIKEEEEALATLRQYNVQVQSMSHCREIGDAVGGSYQFMLSCVEQEIIEASRRS